MRISYWSSDVFASDLEAMKRNPELLREAAAGRSGPMIEAMAREARVRVDPALRADRFVERWQGLSADRDRLYRAGDKSGREKAGQEMAGMAKSLEREPQVDRKGVEEGKSVLVRVDLGGRRIIKKKNKRN